MSPVAFRVAVLSSAVSEWEALGHRELEAELRRPLVFFTQDVADFRICKIYDTTGAERAATPEDCLGLEKSASWDAHSVRRRLLDAIQGRPNADVERLKVRRG